MATKNSYGLPEEAVDRVRERDTRCVYCLKEMVTPSLIAGVNRRDWATIEHFNHLPPWNNPATIAICCSSCNSSKGDKPLLEWLESEYCADRQITLETVAQPVRDYVQMFVGNSPSR